MSDAGGGGSPSRPKRKIKKVMVLSSSGSESDESIGPTNTRKRRLRVLSDDGSDSSGSSVVCAPARRKRALPKLRDSDGDSDTLGWATDHSDGPQPAPSTSKPTSGFTSDSSEGNSDKCSICLMRFTDQEVGTPQTCEHIFCLDCITEWSKNVNTCPVDRLTFNSIVVRVYAGGRVLRTEPVKVVERRPSVDILVVEDPTVCEICGSSDNEEAMLLCDGCDLGFHMQCLTPPLTQVPLDQWFCASCIDSRVMEDVQDLIYFSEVDDLFSDLVDIDLPSNPRSVPLRHAVERNVRRSSRNQNALDQPSTSSGHTSNNSNSHHLPTASRGSRGSQPATRRQTSRRTTTGHRRRLKRNRTKTVIIEYEEGDNGKFPITKKIKRKVKTRKARKRQPRTAARRTHVRASVRAHLAALDVRQNQELAHVRSTAPVVQELSARRQRAGITTLSLFGNQLDYFSEEEYDISEGASTAVARRPTSSILSAYRQARRKMISIPSPTHASSAPDILSGILESQTLLHSKKSLVSVSIDGTVNIKLQTNETQVPKTETVETNPNSKIDLSKEVDAAKKVPAYPGQSRGGGWGGGYRGNYHREQGSGNFNRGGSYDNNYGGGYQNRQGNFHPGNNMWREEMDSYGNFPRRPQQFVHHDDSPHFDRRRQNPADSNRGQPPHGRFNEQARHSTSFPPWGPQSGPRHDQPPHARHSFGGFDNPLDMRMGHLPPPAARPGAPIDAFDSNAGARRDLQPAFQPLPEPPMFDFDKTAELDRSEDERSDSGLVIDTDKYDPTEPTRDDSGDEERRAGEHVGEAAPAPPPPPPPPAPPSPSPPRIQNIIAGIDTAALNVPPNVLDSAVRQVLMEHRNLMAAPEDRSDDEHSDGDCPNFSIYSATSVHIANDSNNQTVEPVEEPPDDRLEDLVREDDEPATAKRAAGAGVAAAKEAAFKPSYALKKSEEEYNQKVSKRCPITTDTRNPIKIKLNTPSLIKRQISLYDDEDLSDEAEPIGACDPEPEPEPDLTPEAEAGDKRPGSPRERSLEDVVDADCDSKAEDVAEPENSKVEENEEERVDRSGSVPAEVVGDGDRPRDGDGESESSGGSGDEARSDEELDRELDLNSHISNKDAAERNEDAIEKMTESISETEDERSYTPCLDENKSKDTSFETEKDKGLEGLDTEMISEDEGNGMFSDQEAHSPAPAALRASPTSVAPPPAPRAPSPPAPVDKERDDGKKKKKKDSKKDGKEKGKGKSKKSEITFKKLSKSGKERNYRERDRDGKSKRERRESSEAKEKERQRQRRKEKRKDLERYDVRTVVTEKRRKLKDPFGRDVSPRERSASVRRSPSPSPRRRRSPSPLKLRRRSTSPPPLRRRSVSPPPLRRRSVSPPPGRRRSVSPPPGRRRSVSPPPGRRRSVSPPPLRRHRSSSPPSSRGHSPPARRLRRAASRSPAPRVQPPARSRSPDREPKRAARKRRKSVSSRRRISPPPGRASPPRRCRSGERVAERPHRSASASPEPKVSKKKKRPRSSRDRSRARRRGSPRRKSPKRKKAKRRSVGRSPPGSEPVPPPAGWSPLSVDSRLLSPRTPPPDPSPESRPPPPLSLAVAERPLEERRRRRAVERPRHKRLRDVGGPSKEVFTSGDNILVSVSFEDRDRDVVAADEAGERRKRRAEAKRDRRKRRKRAAPADAEVVKPVAIIDLERSPFRELTPSPKNVIVLSDSDRGEEEGPARAPAVEPEAPPAAGGGGGGPKTPPSPAAPPSAPEQPRAPSERTERESPRGPNTPPDPPGSPDAYDPFEPTRSASGSPPPAAPPPAASPERPSMTLEAAQKTNLSADEVLDRRPLSPMEKVMALLQSTRDVSPEPPPQAVSTPAAPATPAPAAAPTAPPATPAPPPPGPAPAPAPAGPPVRIVLPSPTRSQQAKLFLGKPTPIKSNPIKPMQATKISKLPLPLAGARRGARDEEPEPGGESPYSPGSSDFGDLFEPPGGGGGGGGKGSRRDAFDSLFGSKPFKSRKEKSSAAKVPVKFNRKKAGKTQVGVKIDDDNLKILDDLPSSAVEMQVKSKFLKKLNRQERVVEEVKLVLKPHYNKKHVTKDEYKDVLRRAVPKICHNKTGEINPAKIQALVEAYVKKIRKKHKLGLD